jgi:two-component system chemotaxis response regulator CheY
LDTTSSSDNPAPVADAAALAPASPEPPEAAPETVAAAPPEAAAPEPAAPPEPPAEKRRVMVVDDVATTRFLLKKILSNAGYDVIEAESGEVAIKTYHEVKPDAVTMDVFLDKLSGVGAMQVILRLDPDARIVMCSSEHDGAFIAETKRMGARAYLRKPFDAQAVRDAVEEALA